MLPPRLIRALANQAGVVSRQQALAAELEPHDVRRLVRRREWVAVHPGVYVCHTGTPTWSERAWAGVLHAWPSALCDVSALRVVEGSARTSDAVIHVAIEASRRVTSVPGVRVHRMRQLDVRTSWNLAPPRLRYEEAVLDVAAGAKDELAVVDVIAAACGSRRTTAARLGDALSSRAWVRHGSFLADVLADVATGTSSVLEHGYLTRVERPHGLPPAQRQLREVTASGVVYRDAAYDGCYVELDGRLHHDSAEQRDRDLDRDLAAAATGRVTVRLGYGQVFGRPCRTAAQLVRVLGGGRPCGTECAVGQVWSGEVSG